MVTGPARTQVEFQVGLCVAISTCIPVDAQANKHIFNQWKGFIYSIDLTDKSNETYLNMKSESHCMNQQCSNKGEDY